MKHIHGSKTPNAKRSTNRPSASGGSRVWAESWIAPERDSKTSAKSSVGYMGKTREQFVDASDRTADPSLAQSRVSDLDDRDFGRCHTSYVPGSIHSRAGKSRASSDRRRKVDATHRQFGGRKERSEENWIPVESGRFMNAKAKRPRLVRR